MNPPWKNLVHESKLFLIRTIFVLLIVAGSAAAGGGGGVCVYACVCARALVFTKLKLLV